MLSRTLLEGYLARATRQILETTRCRYIPSEQNFHLALPLVKSKYAKYEAKPFSVQKFEKKLRNPQPYQTQALPSHQTEIKGVDQAVFNQILRKNNFKKCPPITRSNFLAIQFLPQSHDASRYRKSNVAMLFSTFGISMMNNQKLEEDFKSYNGKYKRLNFMVKNPHPTQSACGRSILKRRFRQFLMDAIEKRMNIGGVEKLSGLFICTVFKVPITKEQENAVRNEFETAVEAISTQPRLWMRLQKQCQESHRPRQINAISLKKHLEGGGVRDPRIRLPFLGYRFKEDKKNTKENIFRIMGKRAASSGTTATGTTTTEAATATTIRIGKRKGTRKGNKKNQVCKLKD